MVATPPSFLTHSWLLAYLRLGSTVRKARERVCLFVGVRRVRLSSTCCALARAHRALQGTYLTAPVANARLNEKPSSGAGAACTRAHWHAAVLARRRRAMVGSVAVCAARGFGGAQTKGQV